MNGEMKSVFDLITEYQQELEAAFKAIPQEQLDAEAERRSAKGKAEAARMAAYYAEHGIDSYAIEEEEDDDEDED